MGAFYGHVTAVEMHVIQDLAKEAARLASTPMKTLGGATSIMGRAAYQRAVPESIKDTFDWYNQQTARSDTRQQEILDISSPRRESLNEHKDFTKDVDSDLSAGVEVSPNGTPHSVIRYPTDSIHSAQ